jgi:tetratricopeptide (TPR) repeat protein
MKQLNRGQLPEAARTFEQALEIHRNLGNPTLQDTSASTKEIEILRNLVEIYTLLKDSNKTIEFSHAILAKVREVGDRDTKLKYQIALGDVYNSLGEYQKAVKSASASLALAGELQNFQAQAVASITLATAYQSLESTKSDYRNATKAAISGLTTAWRVKDHDSEAKALATLGSIYNVLSKNQNAIVFAEQG